MQDTRILVHGDGEPRIIYSAVECYDVALYCDYYSGAHPILKPKLVQFDTNMDHLLAMLTATQEGHFETHAIASVALEGLRVIPHIGTRQ